MKRRMLVVLNRLDQEPRDDDGDEIAGADWGAVGDGVALGHPWGCRVA